MAQPIEKSELLKRVKTAVPPYLPPLKSFCTVLVPVGRRAVMREPELQALIAYRLERAAGTLAEAQLV